MWQRIPLTQPLKSEWNQPIPQKPDISKYQPIREEIQRYPASKQSAKYLYQKIMTEKSITIYLTSFEEESTISDAYGP
jgi:hypothetical protein